MFRVYFLLLQLAPHCRRIKTLETNNAIHYSPADSLIFTRVHNLLDNVDVFLLTSCFSGYATVQSRSSFCR